MVAGLLENYYTCLETMFYRISQCFGNGLASSHRHSDLLEKMNVPVEGIRIEAVSDENFPRLLELLRFRHSRRYYFEMDYDWERLEYLRNNLARAHPKAIDDIRRFIDFLHAL